jgi:hypothetical protein
MRAAEPGNEIEAVYSGQAQVGENDVIITFGDRLQAYVAPRRDCHSIALFAKNLSQ